ncbi:MAG TPA: DNA polymerase III subunit alpha, partial [Dehalococcoidia bacterium]|nr:DNA polymerase III subunit alpha [Dehalococcoidia bacterium]
MADSYVELHCHSNFSLLEGATHPEDLIARAQDLGMPALALTDHDGLYGAVRFWQAARSAGIRPILGCEFTLADGAHLTLLAQNRQGYANLCRLVSQAQLSRRKHQARLDPRVLPDYADHLIALSGCREGAVARALLAGAGTSGAPGKEAREDRAAALAAEYRDIFGPDRFWIELQNHYRPDDRDLIEGLVRVAKRVGAGYVATNNVHYATPAGRRLQDVLVCIKHRTVLDQSAAVRRPNGEFYLKSGRAMAALFAEYPEALVATERIAADCAIDLGFADYRFPGFPVPDGETPFSYLYRLCQEGAARKYRPITPEAAHQLAHELHVIHRLNLAEFFLIVWDIMRYAKEHGIPAQGRGSAADSIVAYVLDITKVDPIRHNLLFERFLNEERAGMPDIDIDFATNHREQVIQYVYEKYGWERTGMVCNVVTYRGRSAVRDVGKVLGLPDDLIDRVAKTFDHRSPDWVDLVREDVGGPHAGVPVSLPSGDEGGSDLSPQTWGAGETAISSTPDTPHLLPAIWRDFLDLCREIEGFPRHLSIHVGGMLITATPLVDVVPLEWATAPGRVVTQYNKDDIEDLHLIKVDLLGLRTLSVVHDALGLIEERWSIRPDL